MATPKVLELCENLYHGDETESSEVLGVVLDVECLGEA